MASSPRLKGTGEADIRPSVVLPGRGAPLWLLIAGVAVFGLILFAILESRRTAMNSPAVKARARDLAGAAPPPPVLYVPPEIQAVVPLVPAFPAPVPRPEPQVIIRQAPAPPPQIVYVPQPAPVEAAPPAIRANSAPTLVIDNGPGATADAAAGAAAPAATAGDTNSTRARAGAFANRSTTVAQGTLIPAVLESALDSTRPGFARAIVSRDVRGFDGSRVLIPRGSRLIGEYRSEVALGQKRALINWTRLIRPDGATIAIGSPAADPLGGTGIRARVNTHFFERFTGAILQSALDIGVNLASRSSNSPVIVALPGALQNATVQGTTPQQVTPTLKVRQGTSISIFVARDLDFTGVENR